MTRWILIVGLVVVPALFMACSDDDSDTIKVGALLPLSGALESYGESSEAALEEAVEAINDSDTTADVELVVEDTESVPETALEKLEELVDDGIRIVIGPYSSSEVAAVLDYANANGVLLLSPLSTAHSLAIAGDNLMRFTPDDIEEGVAVAELAREDGIETLIVVVRDDVGNRGLGVAVTEAFEAAGGEIVEGPVYAADEDDFAAVVGEIEELRADIDAPDGEVGIYLAAFGEAGTLLEAASETESLGSMLWFGSNSVALSGELLENEAASRFAIEVSYPNPILGLRDEDEPVWRPVVDEVNDEIGRDPDAFALAAYDALTTAHAVLIAAGAGAEASALRDALAAMAAVAVGLTGPLELNEAGDRSLASYDFWAVCETDDESFTWVRVATYSDGTATNIDAEC